MLQEEVCERELVVKESFCSGGKMWRSYSRYFGKKQLR